MTKQELKEEYYRLFTDRVDVENDYYDSQFTEGRPIRVFNFMLSRMEQQKTDIIASLEDGKQGNESISEYYSGFNQGIDTTITIIKNI